MVDYFYSWMRQKDRVDWPVARAESDEFILTNGDRVYDFISTSFQTNFGHSFEPIRQRIQKQLSSMPIASPKSSFDLKQQVSERLIKLIDRGPGKMFFTVSGSESVENALKIARQEKQAKIILARQRSYHGATLGALSVTGDWRNRPHLTFDEGTRRIPDHVVDPDADQFQAIVDKEGPENIAAVILETISGTNGMAVPTRDWYARVEQICRANNILFIADEVLVGFGRCGSSFAFHDYGLKPDIVCMSKAISGGYIPFGAVWVSPIISAQYDEDVLACGLTNYGHPLGLAATDGVLDALEDQSFRCRKSVFESLFGEAVASLNSLSNVVQIRQRGLMAAIDFDHAAIPWQDAFDSGLHLFSKDNTVILAPPYVSEPSQFEKVFGILVALLAPK